MPKRRTAQLIGYARVSTKDQSVNQQVQAMLDYGVKKKAIFTETVSGAARKRPQLDAVIAMADPGDTIVVWKLDRFGRSIVDLLQRMKYLEERNVGFISLTDSIDTTTPAGRLMVNMLAAIAQFERDLISERTRAGIRHKMETEAYKPGPVPKLQGKPIKYAQKRRNAGAFVWQIIDELNEKFGIEVSAKTVYNNTVGPSRTRRK
ncbi:MAG: recombinase family protein [Alphaproteobacteria bacterium GM202ARS2]|nr:recombinase family protein [Alphaproteobacteria bacterium GM202ARS2]